MLRMFFFSGTGNARNVAHWIASAWAERGERVEIIDIGAVDRRDLRVEVGDVVGLASPTHGFDFPPITLGFLFRLPRAPGANRAFVVNTRAGLRVFGVPLPGLTGVAQLLAAAVLLLKGYRVVGMRPIDLPSNWISIHPGLSVRNVHALHERCAAITRRFAERMLDGRRDLRALLDLPQDLLLAPFSLAYYLVGRFFFAKSFVASRSCDGCEACVRQCPARALRLVDGRPFWTWRCESCMRCMNNCPRRAIETAHGFVVAVPLLLSAATTALIAPAVRVAVPTLSIDGTAGRIVHVVLDNVLLLAVLFFAYRLLHRGMRLRVVERLVVATSLTHFPFWRRYRAPRT